MRTGQYFKIFTSGKNMRIGKVIEFAESAAGSSVPEFLKKGNRLSQPFPQAIVRVVYEDYNTLTKPTLLHFNGTDIENFLAYQGSTTEFENILKKIEDVKAAEKTAEKAAKELTKESEVKRVVVPQSRAYESLGTPSSPFHQELVPVTLDTLMKSVKIVRPGCPEQTMLQEIAGRSLRINQYNNCKVSSSVKKEQRINLSQTEQKHTVTIAGTTTAGAKFTIGIVFSLSGLPVLSIVEG